MVLLGSCQGGPAQPALDDPAPEALAPVLASPPVPTASERSRIAALGARFSDTHCDTESLGELRELRARLGPRPVKDALIQAYGTCGGDSALADLAAETLSEPPATADLLRLGALYIRADRFEEAAAVLVPIADSPGGASQAQWLAGFALLHGGDPARALPMLSAGRAHASGPGLSEGPMLMGLAHLQLGDPAEAVRLLKQAVALDGENPTIVSALARALDDAGDREAAAEAAGLVQALHRRLAEKERAQKTVAGLVASLERAWAAEHDAEVLRIVERMWPFAPALRPTLLEYRIVALSRLQRHPEADAARAQLETVRGQR